MKQLLSYLVLLLTCNIAVAQNDFTGIAKYKITVEGSSNPATDSMLVIFNKQKIKVILFLPDLKNPGNILAKSFIDNFSVKQSMALSEEDHTYKADTLNASAKYNFINTMKIAGIDNALCFVYRADSTKFDNTQILSVYCLGSIDYRNSLLNNYFFLGIQPIIVDNRIVMDFVVEKPGGLRERIYISDIKKVDNVESYFSLDGYTQE